MGVGDAKENSKAIETIVINEHHSDCRTESRSHLCKKVRRKLQAPSGHEDRREGDAAGRDECTSSWTSLFTFALPRVRDFKGINPNAFDGRGNYALGLKEQLIFPEIEYDKVEKIRGMDIVFVTTAKTDAEARDLLSMLGAPYAK